MSLNEELSNLVLPAAEEIVAPKVDARAAKKAERSLARGIKQTVVTQPEESDPLASMYGDHAMIQSTEVTNRKWTEVHTLTAAAQGEKVLLRGRVHTVRGKGKSAFLVLRQRTSTLQSTMHLEGRETDGLAKSPVNITTVLPEDHKAIAMRGRARQCKSGSIGATEAKRKEGKESDATMFTDSAGS